MSCLRSLKPDFLGETADTCELFDGGGQGNIIGLGSRQCESRWTYDLPAYRSVFDAYDKSHGVLSTFFAACPIRVEVCLDFQFGLAFRKLNTHLSTCCKVAKDTTHHQ